MATATLIPTGTWVVDPTHSNVSFSVKHLGIATVRGTFNAFDGTVSVPEDLATAKVSGSIDVTSVDTKDTGRDEHLRSPDFFDVASFPKLTFDSTRIEAFDEDTFEVVGDLTLHGVTNEVTLTAVVEGTETDPWGNDRVGLSVTGQLSRGDFGMKFNQALGSGNVMVSDKVKLSLDVSAVKQA